MWYAARLLSVHGTVRHRLALATHTVRAPSPIGQMGELVLTHFLRGRFRGGRQRLGNDCLICLGSYGELACLRKPCGEVSDDLLAKVSDDLLTPSGTVPGSRGASVAADWVFAGERGLGFMTLTLKV